METLLSLTSKRAGDWFKEELRLLGGLDHIVDKGVCVCVCVGGEGCGVGWVGATMIYDKSIYQIQFC